MAIIRQRKDTIPASLGDLFFAAKKWRAAHDPRIPVDLPRRTKADRDLIAAIERHERAAQTSGRTIEEESK